MIELAITHTNTHVLWGRCHPWIDDNIIRLVKKGSRGKKHKKERARASGFSINKTDTSHASSHSHCTITRWIFYGNEIVHYPARRVLRALLITIYCFHSFCTVAQRLVSIVDVDDDANEGELEK